MQLSGIVQALDICWLLWVAEIQKLMTTTIVKCACPSCSCDVSGSSAVFKNSQRFCSDACANGHPNNEPCHDADGACGCTCGSWPPTHQRTEGTSTGDWCDSIETNLDYEPKRFLWTLESVNSNPRSAWLVAELHRNRVALVIIHSTRGNKSILPI